MNEAWSSADLAGLAESCDLECKAAQGRDGRGELPEDFGIKRTLPDCGQASAVAVPLSSFNELPRQDRKPPGLDQKPPELGALTPELGLVNTGARCANTGAGLRLRGADAAVPRLQAVAPSTVVPCTPHCISIF